MEAKHKLFTSGRVLAICLAAIAVLRVFTIGANELSWDTFGYYLYLPATFIHHDPLLTDISWAERAMEQYHTTGTLYQISTAPDNSTPMYFFLMGMAICYLPFFLLGHGMAWCMGAPMDGFSMPYQVCMALGGLVYTVIAYWNVRRTLLHFVDDRTTAWTLFVLALGTNLLQFTTIKNLETANFLFCGVAVLMWNSMRWHQEARRSSLLWIAGSIAMITLVKPSEIVCGLLPLLWGVHDGPSLRRKATMLWAHRTDLLLAVGLGLLLLAPQLLYWFHLTGTFVYDSYKNPGVGLDLTRPHMLEVLFSFRKGWLLYTPLMALALVGMVPLYRRQRSMFWAAIAYLLVSFYVLSSWSEWWYGASYSIRPMITLYPVLAIPLALVVERLLKAAPTPRRTGLALIVLLVALNGFQLWQFNNWVIHPFRTTKAYYLAVLGRTTVPPGAAELLSADWKFDGSERMGPPEDYRVERSMHVDLAPQGASGGLLAMGPERPFATGLEVPFKEITTGEYCWLTAEVRVQLPADAVLEKDTPCLVFAVERKEGSYGYRTFCVDGLDTAQRTITLSGSYMTPPIRDVQDRVKVYVWHRGSAQVWIEDLRISAYLPLR